MWVREWRAVAQMSCCGIETEDRLTPDRIREHGASVVMHVVLLVMFLAKSDHQREGPAGGGGD